MSEPGEAGKGSARCPICGRSADQKYRPFCSKRCADVDLSRWLSGAYVISRSADDEDDDGLVMPPPANDDDERDN